MTTLVAFTRRSRRHSRRGFALVATLSIIALLTILTMGLLSLSQNSLRRNTQDKARAEAQANARLSLALAIGALQKQLGPDQRISANGEILSDPESPTSTVANRHWTGVWNSWKAGVGEASQHSTIGQSGEMAPKYEPNRRDYFRGWLLSLNPDEAKNVDVAKSLNLTGELLPQGAATAIRLVAEGSLGVAAAAIDKVSARLLSSTADASGRRNRHAFWVGDESQKARILGNSYRNSAPNSLAERLNRQQAPASLGNSEIKGLENVADETSLSMLPNRETLALVKGASEQVEEQFHDISITSLGILADVREGGLKRDLSTILERQINPDDVYNFTNVEEFRRAISMKTGGDDFMLYRFDDLIRNTYNGTTGQAAVPIQDLAAYYQLYDRYRSGSMGGIQYSSGESSPPNDSLNNGIMVSNPDYGVTGTDQDKYLRQYTALYRNPVPVKIEMILSYITEMRTQAELDADRASGIINPDPYKLRIGISPAVTFWNPNNVPLVMNISDANLYSYRLRETPIPLRFKFKKSDSPSGAIKQQIDVDFNKVTNTQQGELYTLYVSGNYRAVFQPGESKVFALRFASNTSAGTATNNVDFLNRAANLAENFMPDCELVPGWNPEKFIRPIKGGRAGTGVENIFTFKDTEYISASVSVGGYNEFGVSTTQQSRTKRNLAATKYHFRTYDITSRLSANTAYRDSIVYQGFPLNGSSAISDATPRTIDVPAKSGVSLINAMRSPFNPRDDLPAAFFYYGIKAATETHESNQTTGVDGSSRRFPSRPFTHSTAMSPPFLDSTDPASLYNYGLNWFFMPLDNLNDAPIEISRSNSGYYAGGYTAENGVTHAVQQQLPLTPPISIATLSHAHLGGFSLATEAVADGYTGLGDRAGPTDRFRRTTAAGWDGLAPHTLQAIGNSYAHPNIPADKALSIWRRQFDQRYAAAEEPLVDHSYLANKALWDEYFFSSISPKPANVKAFSEVKTVKEVASEFFFAKKPLPNPRIVPYPSGLDKSRLEVLLSDYNKYKAGFADKIAAHLMVEGPFNINSTSVASWKALFSSLKGQDVTYLDAKSALVVGTNLDFEKLDGVPLTGGPLPNGKAYQESSTDPSDPEQWTGFRELTETEIDELATAMVKQVKLRGPFLSLSDFVNRRLDARPSEKERALKGALQAALDDPAVSINKGFRDDLRKFSNREKSFVNNAKFPEAMEGPIAYGSAAYVDQADILRNFPAQLTPRGDTFVVRAYSDSVDTNGKIMARIWCEAIVQRVPEYINPVDNPEVRQADLTSKANQHFGRRFAITQFRWLDPSEI